MPTLVFDIECNGFLNDLNTIHCIVTEDVDTGEIEAYYGGDREIRIGLDKLYLADKIVGHNIITYDIPAIKKLYPQWDYNSLDDTFLLSCILHPERQSHSIEAYSGGLKVKNKDYSCLTYNLLDRCVIDTKVCANIYRDQLKILSSTSDYNNAIKLEYQVAKNHVRQVRAGVDFDLELAYKTLECLDAELEGLRGCIYNILPYRMVVDKHQYKRFFLKNGEIDKNVRNYLQNLYK